MSQVATLLLLDFLIPVPLPGRRPAAPRPDWAAWAEMLADYQQRGVAVVGSHPRCAEPNLDGLYIRGRSEVVVCPRGEPSTTLRHEGWHLVQSLCLGGRPWIEPAQIERLLSRDDRRELQALVAPERRHREAEARVMARQSPAVYLQAMDRACACRLPFGGVGAAPSDAQPSTRQI
ncbi:MAG: hypothetical protein ACKO25_11090 [Cyanobium sp.]